MAWQADIRTISPMHITKSLRVDSQVGVTAKCIVYHVTYDVAVAVIFLQKFYTPSGAVADKLPCDNLATEC